MINFLEEIGRKVEWRGSGVSLALMTKHRRGHLKWFVPQSADHPD
jgi:hypothetical protein